MKTEESFITVQKEVDQQEDKILWSAMPVDFALQLHLEQGDADIVQQIMSLKLKPKSWIYRSDYIRPRYYQVEEITEEEACRAFSKSMLHAR